LHDRHGVDGSQVAPTMDNIRNISDIDKSEVAGALTTHF